MISGWAVEPNAIYRYQVDAAFPLSDHADYDDLLRYVELVQPQRVLTLARLRGGIRARPARPRRRSVGLERAESNGADAARTFARRATRAFRRRQSTESRRERIVDSEFRAFAELGEQIAATPAKLEKVRLLAEYLRTLDPEQLRIAAIFLTGKAIRANRPANLADWLGDHLPRASRRERARRRRAAPDREQPRRREQSRPSKRSKVEPRPSPFR